MIFRGSATLQAVEVLKQIRRLGGPASIALVIGLAACVSSVGDPSDAPAPPSATAQVTPGSAPPPTGTTSPAASPSTEPTVTPTPVAPDEADFRLSLEAPREQWAAQPLEIEAWMVYTGPYREVTVWGPEGGLAALSLERTTDEFHVGGRASEQCAPYTFSRNEPQEIGLVKSAVWEAGDQNAAFYEAYLADPELHLPAGSWRITADAIFLPERSYACGWSAWLEHLYPERAVHVQSSALTRMTPVQPIATPAQGCSGDFTQPDGKRLETVVLDNSMSLRVTMVTGWWWRNRTGSGDVDYGVYEIDLPDRPLDGPRGGTVEVVAESGYQIVDATATLFGARRFVTDRHGLVDEGPVLEHPATRFNEDGNPEVTLPNAPGSWVIRLDVVWMSPCLGGNGEVHFRVETR